jgi:hypothetical protein
MLLELISTGAAIGIFAAITKYLIDARKIRLDEQVDGRLATKEVIDLLRESLKLAREEHAECNKRLNVMQGEIFSLQDKVHTLQLANATFKAANAA